MASYRKTRAQQEKKFAEAREEAHRASLENVPVDIKAWEQDLNIAEFTRKAFQEDEVGFLKRLKEEVLSMIDDTSGLVSPYGSLSVLQQRIADLFDTDVLIGAAGEVVSLFSLGAGVEFSSGSKELDAYLRDMWGKYGFNLEARQDQIALYLYLLSEYIIIISIPSDIANRDVRNLSSERKIPVINSVTVFPWQISDIFLDKDNTEYVVGVAINKEGTEYFYKTVDAYLFPELHPEVVNVNGKKITFEEDKYIMYFRGQRGLGIRGAPVPRRGLRWATIAREIVLDTASKYHEWAKVLYKLLVKNKSIDKSQSLIRNAPVGGTILYEDSNYSWDTMETKMDSQGMKSVWHIIMYYLSAALRIPYQALLFDYSDSDYAGSRQGDKPLTQFIGKHQRFLKDVFESMFVVGIQLGIEAKCLKDTLDIVDITEEYLYAHMSDIVDLLEKYPDQDVRFVRLMKLFEETAPKKKVPTKDVPISFVFPETAGETLLNKARAIELFDRAGIASKQSLAELAGFNWPTEVARMLAGADLNRELSKRSMLADKDGNPDLMPDSDERSPGDDDYPRPRDGEDGGQDRFGSVDRGTD